MKEFEGKKLLVLGGFRLACDIIRRAKAIGSYVIVADQNPNLPGNALADKFVQISILDVDAIVDFCRAEKVDGVTTGFVDILLPACYEICKRLNLPYYASKKMISMATNKVDFKDTCMKYGVPVPQTYHIGSSIPAEVFNKIQYPVFVKPMDASGSRGAGVCYNKDELLQQFESAVDYSDTDNAIIEDFLTGREFLANYIAVNGEYRLISLFDRYMSKDRGSAVNFSNMSMAPSKAIDNYLNRVNDKVENMFRELGFNDGILFLQGHSNGEKITFYEMGCRLGGSYYNLEAVNIGENPIDMLVRYAFTGKMVNDISKIRRDVAKYEKYAIACNYLLKNIDDTIFKMNGIEKVKAMPGCVAVLQYLEEGHHFTVDRTVDKAVLTSYMVVDDFDAVKSSLKYINDTFDVLNERGESLLMEKLQPEDL